MPVAIRTAMEMVRAGTHCLLVWNACYGGGPCLSEDGKKLMDELTKEGFDKSCNIILMEVLRRLGPSKATGKYSKFALGLIDRKYASYTIRDEYDGYEGMSPDPDRFVKDKLEKILDKNGAITKEEYASLKDEAEGIGIIHVSITEAS